MRCTKAKINNHKSICIPLLTTPPDPKTFQISHFCQSNAFVQFMANTLPNHHNTWGADPFEQFDPPILLPIQKPSNYPMSANQMPSSNSWPTPCQIIITPGVLILSNNLIHLLYATTYLFTLVNWMLHLHLAQHPLLVFWGAIPGPMSIQQNHPKFTHFNLPSHCPEATRACDYSRCNLRRHWKIHEFRTEIDKFPTNHLSFPKDYAYLGSNLGLIQRKPVSFGVSSPSIIKFSFIILFWYHFSSVNKFIYIESKYPILPSHPQNTKVLQAGSYKFPITRAWRPLRNPTCTGVASTCQAKNSLKVPMKEPGGL